MGDASNSWRRAPERRASAAPVEARRHVFSPVCICLYRSSNHRWRQHDHGATAGHRTVVDRTSAAARSSGAGRSLTEGRSTTSNCSSFFGIVRQLGFAVKVVT